jgi:hypothetical protein
MIDLITCQPKDVYYPFWVEQMVKNRKLFGRIIVMMTQDGERDYSRDLERIPDVTVLSKYPKTGDWRDQATREALKYSLGDRILFTEQDLITGPDFYSKLLEVNDPVVGFWDGNRLHPACLLIDKILLKDADFSVEPDVGDHFYKLTQKLIKDTTVTLLEALGLPYLHLAGLTQNYRLKDNFYQPNQFLTYNTKCLPLHMPDSWRELVLDILKDQDFTINKEVSDYFDQCFS